MIVIGPYLNNIMGICNRMRIYHHIEYPDYKLEDLEDFNSIHKILLYENSYYIMNNIIAMSHIFRKILGNYNNHLIEILERLHPNRLYAKGYIDSLNLKEITVDIDRQKIPIIEEIAKNKYVYYKDNFIRYRDSLEKQLWCAHGDY